MLKKEKFEKLVYVLYAITNYSITKYMEDYIEVLRSILEDDFSQRPTVEKIYKRLLFVSENASRAKRTFSSEEVDMITDDVIWLIDNAKYLNNEVENDYNLYS